MINYGSMKRVLLSFLLLICVGLFAGCTTTSGVSYVNIDVTSIYIAVSYDEDNLEKIGIDTDGETLLIKQDIELKASSYMDQLLKKYRDIINAIYSNGAITDNEKILYKNHLSMYSGWDDESYIIELRFYTTTASRIFIKYGGTTEGADISSSLFITTVTEEYTDLFTDTPDSIISISVNDYFTNSVSNVIFTNFGGTAQTNFDGISVNYMFLTDNSRLHSNGILIDTTEGTLHYFTDSDEGNSFAFYRIEVNRYVWYLFALTVSMIFIAILLIVVYFRKDNKTKEIKIDNLNNDIK